MAVRAFFRLAGPLLRRGAGIPLQTQVLGAVLLGLDLQRHTLLALEQRGDRRQVERDVVPLRVARQVPAGVVAQFDVEVAFVALLRRLDPVDDQREVVLRVIHDGVAQVEREPLVAQVAVGGRDARGTVAQLFEAGRRIDLLRCAGVDLLHGVEGDVVVVALNPLQEVEPDDGPLPVRGPVGRHAALVARVERLAVVALEVVVAAAGVDRADGSDQRGVARVVPVVVVACAEERRQRRNQKQTEFFHISVILCYLVAG